MIDISNAQVNALAAASECEFIDRLTKHLKTHHAEATAHLTDDLLRQRAVAGVARGRRHRFTWQSALTGFVGLMFEVAPNFDKHPAFRRALESKNADENERIREIYRGVTDAEWAEAQEFADEGAWMEKPL